MATSVRADDALLRPVRAGNAFEETVQRLLQAIRLGAVGTGERLPAERELAAKLNVSRVTLREAIRVLQDTGYVVSRRGRYGGTFVTDQLPRPSSVPVREPADVEDALTMRRVLEPGAAEIAASRTLSPQDRAHLRRSIADTMRVDLADYRRRDSRLHLAIAEVTASSSLTAAVADVRMRLNDLLDAIPLIERNIEHSDRQHRQIVDAILAGDPAAARQAMVEHLDGTAALLRGFLA